MLSKSSSEQLINTSSVSMKFYVYNLLSGIVCLGAALLILGCFNIIKWHRSQSVSKPKVHQAIFHCASFLIMIYVGFIIVVAVLALLIFRFIYKYLDELQELCSPWPLYSALVSSALVVGVEGLLVCILLVAVLCGFVCAVFFCIYVSIMSCTARELTTDLTM